MKKSSLPLHFQSLEEVPYNPPKEAPQVRVAIYQTNRFFPTSFYKPIINGITKPRIIQKNER